MKGDEALHTRLLANGVLHYFIINLVGVLNLAFLLQGTPQLKPLLTDAFIVASSILATRLVLYSRSYLPKSTPFDGKPTHPFHPTKSLVAPFNDLTPTVRVGLKSHLGPEVDLDYLTHEEKRERRDLGLDVSVDDETESI